MAAAGRAAHELTNPGGRKDGRKGGIQGRGSVRDEEVNDVIGRRGANGRWERFKGGGWKTEGRMVAKNKRTNERGSVRTR